MTGCGQHLGKHCTRRCCSQAQLALIWTTQVLRHAVSSHGRYVFDSAAKSDDVLQICRWLRYRFCERACWTTQFESKCTILSSV